MRSNWIPLFALLAACHSAPTTELPASDATAEAPAQPAPLPAPDTASSKAVSTNSDTLRVVRQPHNFSNPQGPADQFRLVWRGPALLQGTGEFTITNPDGQVIFREILTAPDLEAALVYELKNPAATPAERKAYVQKRLDQFFQPAQFHTPAVARNAPYPSGLENLTQAAWDDLRQRPDAIRFDYLKGKEDRRQIAWSPVLKQTVRIK